MLHFIVAASLENVYRLLCACYFRKDNGCLSRIVKKCVALKWLLRQNLHIIRADRPSDPQAVSWHFVQWDCVCASITNLSALKIQFSK